MYKKNWAKTSFPQLSTHDCEIIKHFWAFDVQRLELCVKPLWHTHTKEASSKKTVLSCLCEILSVSLAWEFLPVDFLMLSAGDGANTEILSGFLSRVGPAPQPSRRCWRGFHTPVPTSSLADVQRPHSEVVRVSCLFACPFPPVVFSQGLEELSHSAEASAWPTPVGKPLLSILVLVPCFLPGWLMLQQTYSLCG